jgi:hypothetical protein
MKSRRVFRFEIADRDALERLAELPLPGLSGETREVITFRDVYFDTAAGDLRTKGALARLRIRGDGRCDLLVDVVLPSTGNGPDRRRSREVVPTSDPAEIFAGTSGPAELLRALTDPARLAPAFEIETLRRRRTGTLDNHGDTVTLSCDLHTVRHGSLSGDLFAARLRVPDDAAAVTASDAVLRAMRHVHGLRPALTDSPGRARQLLASIEVDALSESLRAAREVAVVPFRSGEVGMVRGDAGGLYVPTGPCPRPRRRR